MKNFSFVYLAIIHFALPVGASGTDADLIGIIKEGRKFAMLPRYLEPSVKIGSSTNESGLKLKKIHAFGAVFVGDLNLIGEQTGVFVWAEEAAIAPQVGVAIFKKAAEAFSGHLGEGKIIANIPNYGDASDVQSMAMLWFIGVDVILLQLDRYPSRAGISVVRRSMESWRGSMGADESAFWVRRLGLQAHADAESQQQPFGGRASNEGIGDFGLNRGESQEVQETKFSSERSVPFMPWSVVAVLIIAAIIMRVVLCKRRS